MDLKEYEKIDIASQMLETALSLFLEEKDYFSVLQIAGACDEILGKYLKLKEIDTSLETETAALISIKKNLNGIHSTVKDTRNFLNQFKNAIKHMDDRAETTVIMDPEFEAETMLDRAIVNWWRLGKRHSPLMEKFLDLMETKYVSKNLNVP